ncbi:coenzyme F420-0:L-glutamate ligase [Candidatus Gottesmanbacteria bacterium]|nr:coenzyme F420-0:L-glutamate ligase [Candidatus Gottesmanbacteria bacterium]
MIVTAIKTHAITISEDIFTILDQYIHDIYEKDVIVVTSKIVSICQGRVVKNDGTTDKNALIRKEAQLYIDKPESRYYVMLTIKDNILISSSGIDQSNGNGYFVLWPEHIHEVTANIWKYLRSKYRLKQIGVLVTDTRATPLRWGTIGVGLSWCGFEPLKNYIGEPDIFGEKLRMTKASVIDGLSAAADMVIGQGDEQTPLAIIRDIPFVQFLNKQPSDKEIEDLKIDPADDLFSPLTDTPKWKKGGA